MFLDYAGHELVRFVYSVLWMIVISGARRGVAGKLDA